MTEVHGSTLHDRSGGSFLVLVVTGRASGRRALLVVLSRTWAVIYEERLERAWRGDSVPLQIRYDAGIGSEVAVVCPSCQRPRAIAIKFATQPAVEATGEHP